MAEVELPNVKELEEIKAKTFTRRIALTTAIFAVLLAITSLGGNNAMKEMLLAQQQASDQWAFYQSKALREHLYKTNGLRIEMELLERGEGMRPEAKKRYEAMLKDIRAEETRFGEEKKKIEEEAKQLETERDKNRSKDPYFDFAEVLLQISIVLASISILAVSRQIFYFALVSASLGTILMLNGYLLLFKLPFFH
ncbi:MAG TPA: DUF4337 domain-containing protein [Nitrospirota bacterium]|nr:DUF4337 domain-containing protein [Nitrospirota bacterium]